MARSFLSMDGVGPSVDVVDDALLVMYALTVQRLSDVGESCATLHELLAMGPDHQHGHAAVHSGNHTSDGSSMVAPKDPAESPSTEALAW